MGTDPIIADRYKVVNSISGGMGQVFFCLDTKRGNSPVALKTIKSEFLSNHILRERFLREATIWIHLGLHKNIVQAYKAIYISEDQSFYITMQLIPAPPGLDNPSLRAYLTHHKNLPVEESLKLALGIIQGMIHATNIYPTLVHRDLKPENILIGTDWQPKITDFGLAGINFEEIENGPTHTRRLLISRITETEILGTPLYMSPEQWNGDHLDERTDIYSLGCILYEMLIGDFAVQGNTTEELFLGHIQGRALENVIRSNLNPSIKSLLQKCLYPNRNGQYVKGCVKFQKPQQPEQVP